MALRIKEVIKEQGTTVQELADKMGISRVGLSQHITILNYILCKYTYF